MKKLLQKILLGVSGVLLLANFVAVPVMAADAKQSVCEGLELSGGGNCVDPQPGPSVESTIKVVVNILSLIVGVVSVIMIIIGGLKYITSSGDSNNVQGAKNTILYAIIGLVVVLLAQVIVRFVIVTVSP